MLDAHERRQATQNALRVLRQLWLDTIGYYWTVHFSSTACTAFSL